MTTPVRRLLQVLLPLVVVGLGVGGMLALASLRDEPVSEEPGREVPLVGVVRAVEEPVRTSVRAHGTVVPRTETTLVAEVDGRVLAVAPELRPGGFFEAGEELLRLDPTDHELALEEARRAVAEAELRLAQEQADADVARAEWESLGREGEPSALVLREPQLVEARASLAAARARVARAERDVERTRVLAPYDGRVRSERVDPGQYLGRGATIAEVYATDRVEVHLPLALDELALVDVPLARRAPTAADGGGAPGPTATLRARIGGALHRWQGRVVRTEGEVDPDAQTLTVVVGVDDPYGSGDRADRPPLAVGLFVEAELEGRTLERAVVLPREALRGRDRVFVVADGRLSIREVDVVASREDTVVVGAGVDGGELVAVTPLERAVDGMRVRTEEAGGDAAARTGGGDGDAAASAAGEVATR